MEELERVADALRGAVAAGDFAHAQKTAVEYARAVAERARALEPGSPESDSLYRDTQELLAWTLEIARARRSQLALRLDALRPLRAYLQNQNLDRA
jgi:hypothetical protein